VALVFLRLGCGVSAAMLFVGMVDKQGFHLPQEILSAQRFDEQRVRGFPVPTLAILMFLVLTFPGGSLVVPIRVPIRSRRWMGREERGGGIVGLAARAPEHLETGIFCLHAQIADHHVENAGLHARESLGGTGGSFDFKSVEFKDGLQRQEHREIVID
jgi:hypothetical protein